MYKWTTPAPKHTVYIYALTHTYKPKYMICLYAYIFPPKHMEIIIPLNVRLGTEGTLAVGFSTIPTILDIPNI